jgi:hypothetical protein
MYAGKRPDPMDFRRILKAVFQPELSRIVSDDFRPVPTGKYRQLAGIHRKKIRKTSGRNTASISEGFPMLSCGIRRLFEGIPGFIISTGIIYSLRIY